MDNIVDLLLEEMDQELSEDNSFEKFLEDMNVNIILEDNDQQQSQDNNQQQTNQQNGFKDKAKNIANNAKEQAGNLIDGLLEKFQSIGSKVDGFVSGQINSATKGLSSLSEKINGNETVKSIEELSIASIEFLRVPKLVIRAGSDLKYVYNAFQQWTSGIFGGFKKKGAELKNNAVKGFNEAKKAKETNDESKTGFLQNIMNVCNSLLGGLRDSVSSLGKAFANMWKTVKSSLNGGAKQESVKVFITLDEEVDYLLS